MIEDDSQQAGAALERVAGDLRAVDGAARDLSRAVGGSLRGALDEAVRGGARLGDVLRGMAADMAKAGLRDALTPLTNAVGQGAGALLSGAVRGLAGQFGSGLGGSVRAFARGGVVDAPTGFAAGGGLGVMGEAGPEAILPLARGADGRLGVRGGGGVQVTLNLATPDAESFARSRPQIAAALARAVARGTRRL
jgi:phage-related minor tail protein